MMLEPPPSKFETWYWDGTRYSPDVTSPSGGAIALMKSIDGCNVRSSVLKTMNPAKDVDSVWPTTSSASVVLGNTAAELVAGVILIIWNESGLSIW